MRKRKGTLDFYENTNKSVVSSKQKKTYFTEDFFLYWTRGAWVNRGGIVRWSPICAFLQVQGKQNPDFTEQCEKNRPTERQHAPPHSVHSDEKREHLSLQFYRKTLRDSFRLQAGEQAGQASSSSSSQEMVFIINKWSHSFIAVKLRICIKRYQEKKQLTSPLRYDAGTS